MQEQKNEISVETTPTYFQAVMDDADGAFLRANGGIAANYADIAEKKQIVGDLLGEVALAMDEVEGVAQVQTELLGKANESAQRVTELLSEAKELFPEAKHKGLRTSDLYTETQWAKDYPNEYIDIDNPRVAEFLSDREILVRSSRKLVEARCIDDGGKNFHARFDTACTVTDGQNGLEIIVNGQGGRQSTVTVSDGLQSMKLTPEEVRGMQSLADLTSALFPGVTLEARADLLASTGWGATDSSLRDQWGKKFQKMQKEDAPLVGKELSLAQLFDTRQGMDLPDLYWSDYSESLLRNGWAREARMQPKQLS